MLNREVSFYFFNFRYTDFNIIIKPRYFLKNFAGCVKLYLKEAGIIYRGDSKLISEMIVKTMLSTCFSRYTYYVIKRNKWEYDTTYYQTSFYVSWRFMVRQI